MPKNPEQWRDALRLISRCPICNGNYVAEQAKVFARHETATLIHLTCDSCKSNFVAMILTLGQGLSSVGMVTDLNFEDEFRLDLHYIENWSLWLDLIIVF